MRGGVDKKGKGERKKNCKDGRKMGEGQMGIR